jgi:Flp pilus assembly protein TadB
MKGTHMNDPFNPIHIPENLNLISETAATPGEKPGAAHQEANNQSRRKARKRTTKRRPAHAAMSEAEAKSKWHRIKGKLAAKMAGIDPNKLRQVLLGCGVAAGTVMAVLLAIKLMPVAVILLALLGLWLVIQLWDRLRYFPRPF